MEPYTITITGVNFADLKNKIFSLATELYAQLPAQPTQQPSAAPTTVWPQPSAVVASVTPAQTQAPAVPIAPSQAPTVTPKYTLDDLQLAVAPLIDAGKQPELLQILSSFGVQAITHLSEEQYGAFATAIRQLGAKI